jgi:hypothetical protein
MEFDPEEKNCRNSHFEMPHSIMALDIVRPFDHLRSETTVASDTPGDRNAAVEWSG